MYLLVNTIRFLVKLIPALLCLAVPYYFYSLLYPDYRYLIVLSALIPFGITLALELTGTFPARSLSSATAGAVALAGIIGFYFEYKRLATNLPEPLAALLNDPGYYLEWFDRNLVLACLVCIGVAVFHNTLFLEKFRHKQKAKVNKTAHGSASWLTPARALREAFSFGELVVGKHSDQILRVDGSGHLVTIAGSGSGKTTSVSIPNCFSWSANLVATDPKGEIHRAVVPSREKLGQTVLILSPEQKDCASINVLDWIDLTEESAIENVDAIISWLDAGSADGKQSENESFTVNAKSVIKTVILAVLYSPELPKSEKNLAKVREYLTRQDLVDFLETIAETDKQITWGAMQQLASQMLAIAASDRTWSGVIAHIEQLTSWLSTPSLKRLVVGNDITPTVSEITSGPYDVFLSIPLKTLNSTPGVARLLLGSLLNGVYERYHKQGDTNQRTLFLLDEMPRLKRMELLETARDAGRGYGVTLWAIIQDLGQLEKWYGKEGARSWLENSQVRTFFGISDIETAKYISESLGKETIETETEAKTHSQSSQTGKIFGGRTTGMSYTRNLVGKPLMSPDEILSMKAAANGTAEEQIIFRRGFKPFRASLAKYYEMPEFQM